MLLAVCMMALVLVGCGRKAQPKHPEGSQFPGVYPYIPETEAERQSRIERDRLAREQRTRRSSTDSLSLDPIQKSQ